LVTRFRPTPYREMHCGHVWTAYHNWHAARAAGGRFVLIADDVAYNLQRLNTQSWPCTECVDRYVADLCWLGMGPDKVVWSTDNAEAHAVGAEVLGIQRAGLLADCSMGLWSVGQALSGAQLTSYHPWIVMVRVIDDWVCGVTDFWRGADLIHETQLYDYLARQLSINPPRQSYLPLVTREAVSGKESKSNGAISVRALREAGYTAAMILDTLRESARRCSENGRSDVQIPAGILDPAAVQSLSYRGLLSAWDRHSAGYKGEAFYDAARFHNRTMRRRLGMHLRAREAKQVREV
jgi:hypothetical protein